MTVAVIPVAKPRMTQRDKWAQRPAVMKYRAFKDRLKMAIGFRDIPQPCKVTFHLPMPDSWSKRKRMATLGQPHLSKPDVDNLVKGLMDALYTDDAHIWSLWGEKRWAVDGRIEIEAL
jgi:Holliday junction resolvase RusA-like endonuclease